VSDLSLAMRLQAVLFVAPNPVSIEQLAAATGEPAEAVREALAALVASVKTAGIRASELNGLYQLVSAPEAAADVVRFLQDETSSDLSKPALETLAIVAYRGPIAKSQIEAIRGVASDTMVRNLLARGLIAEAGKSPEPGRPALYAISHAFLQHFGLTSPKDLPPVPEAGK
jgi:segregation and condensation protein B